MRPIDDIEWGRGELHSLSQINCLPDRGDPPLKP